jgi:hypothetical protein
VGAKVGGPIHDFVVRDRYLLAADVATIVAAILAILVVRQIDSRQRAKFQKLSSWSQGLTPGP